MERAASFLIRHPNTIGIHTMDDTFAHLTQAMLDAAQRAGADAADAIVIENASVNVDVRDGKLEQTERAEGREIGIRALVGHRQACVAASDTAPETLVEMATRAVAMARAAPEDPTIGLAEAAQLSPVCDGDALDLHDPMPDPHPTTLEDIARRAEAAALAVGGVSQVQSASAGFARWRFHMAATNGFSGGYARSNHAVSCIAITGEGLTMERDYDSDSRSHAADLMSPDHIGRTAGERAVARAGARKPPTGAFPVLYDERISASLIGHLVAACSGAAIVRGASWLRDALGELVLPPDLTLTEDPHRKRVSGSSPFDGEGIATMPRDIVKNGVLCGWTLDLGTGRKLGLPSTGNATRGAASPPYPSIGNLTLTPGGVTQAQLMADMGRGLLVTAMLGASINPTTGDYSRGAAGFWVENGEIAYPVNECTIAGNLRSMLQTLRPANDARPYRSRVIPSLLVEGLTIAGE